MTTNYVDYDVLTQGASVYQNQAEALDTVIQTLTRMNTSLQGGWSNETARAFVERFEAEHKPALQNARDAIASISAFITSYMNNRKDEDHHSAAGVRG